MTDNDVTMADGVPRIGVFANAFRVVRDTDSEYFLDFIQYSGSEKLAQVISRVRINHQFLAAIQQRIESVTTTATVNTGDKGAAAAVEWN